MIALMLAAVLQPQNKPQPTLTLEELAARVTPVVARLDLYDSAAQPVGMASGFMISRQNLVTCWHVASAAHSIKVLFKDGHTAEVVSVIADSKDSDLVVLEIGAQDASLLFDEPTRSNGPLRLSSTLPLQGSQIAVLGSPRGLDFTLSDGIVSSVRSDPKIGELIQITAAISPGSSGSPALNRSGEVIGVVSFFLSEGQNLNFAASAVTLNRLPRHTPEPFLAWTTGIRKQPPESTGANSNTPNFSQLKARLMRMLEESLTASTERRLLARKDKFPDLPVSASDVEGVGRNINIWIAERERVEVEDKARRSLDHLKGSTGISLFSLFEREGCVSLIGPHELEQSIQQLVGATERRDLLADSLVLAKQSPEDADGWSLVALIANSSLDFDTTGFLLADTSLYSACLSSPGDIPLAIGHLKERFATVGDDCSMSPAQALSAVATIKTISPFGRMAEVYEIEAKACELLANNEQAAPREESGTDSVGWWTRASIAWGTALDLLECRKDRDDVFLTYKNWLLSVLRSKQPEQGMSRISKRVATFDQQLEVIERSITEGLEVDEFTIFHLACCYGGSLESRLDLAAVLAAIRDPGVGKPLEECRKLLKRWQDKYASLDKEEQFTQVNSSTLDKLQAMLDKNR